MVASASVYRLRANRASVDESIEPPHQRTPDLHRSSAGISEDDRSVTQLSDTIFAVSSSVFPAARVIVRLAGPEAFAIARRFCPELADTAGASTTILRLDGMQIPASVYRFRGPLSYSGDDIIELHIPGNPLLTQLLLEAIAKSGGRPAEAGEFTARAYFNGRLNLAQAEGVAIAVSAHSEREAAAARRLLAGELTAKLGPMIELVATTLALLEAGIDFSEEGIAFLSGEQIGERIDRVMQQLRDLLAGSVRFERLTHEPAIVLAGRPNAGKSTLLNALAGRHRAVVSATAGTTRDVIWSTMRLPRGYVRVSDTAGLEEPSPDASDPEPLDDIERQMRRQAHRAIVSADVLVLVVDGGDERPHIVLPRAADVVVRTKADLQVARSIGRLRVSARTGAGLDALRRSLDAAAFGGDSEASDSLALNARHVTAIERAMEHLSAARETLAGPGREELIALDLREALDALGAIAGQITPDDVLGRIFAAFCIGK
jgi:tRNA modification GTPase